MADPVSVAGLALTVAGAGAKLSLGLFEVAHAFKNAPHEIADIAHELSTLSIVLNQLGEVLSLKQTRQCKPELFEITRSTLGRFDDVQTEIHKITGNPKSRVRKLRRLKWFFDAPKAKVLLQKVESIKSALTLILGIIQIAEEQIEVEQRANASPFVLANHSTSRNRYRKTVESLVQANRLAVENAQKEEEHNPTEKRRRYDGTLQRWCKDNDDTATWLYHLVFETGITKNRGPAMPSTLSSGDGHSTISIDLDDDDDDDAKSDTSEHFEDASDKLQPTPQVGSTRATNEREKCTDMIVWNGLTEPSGVVDRLLQAWTYLRPEQIQATKADYLSEVDKTWKEDLITKIQEYLDEEKKRNEKPKGRRIAFANEDSEYSDDESDFLGSGSPVPGSLPKLPERNPFVPFTTGLPQRTPGRRGHRNSIPPDHISQTSSSQYPGNSPHYSQYGPPSGLPPGGPSPFPSYPIYPPGYAETIPSTAYNPYGHPGPFATTSPPSPPPPPTPVPAPAPVPPPPPEPVVLDSRQERILDLIAKLESNRREDMSAIETKFAQIFETLLQTEFGSHGSAPSEFSADHDKRVESLYELFQKYQEEQIARETKAKALAEAERARAEEKKNREAEEKARAAAHAEAIENAVKKARQEVEEKAAREAKLAQEAVDKQLAEILEKVSKTEAEVLQRAKDEADAKAAAEKKEAEDNYKKLIEMYREELKSYKAREEEQQAPKSKPRTHLAPPPLRTTTFISGNDRRVEVHEYADAHTDPYATVRRGLARSASGEPHGFDFFPPSRRNRRPPSVDHSPSGIFHGSARSIVSDDDDETRSSHQKVIMLPSRPHRDPATISQMQSCLDECGMSVQFENPGNRNNMLIPSDYAEEDSISGTVFWEPPSLSASSELLRNLKLQGWKPLYIRISDCGQTYFLGNQPVHVNFFKPQYKPQMDASLEPSSTEYVVLGKDLIHEYALQELGFDFKPTDSGGYALDCRLTSYDIEHLIERSFMIRETHFRSQFRKLTWKTEPKDDEAETLDDQSSDTSSVAGHSADDIDDRGNETSFTSDAMDDDPYESFEHAMVRLGEDEDIGLSPVGLPRSPCSASAISHHRNGSDLSLRRRQKKSKAD